MREHRVPGMKAAETRVAEDALEAAAAENAEAAAQLQRHVHHAPGALDRTVLRRHDLRRPHRLMIDPARPVFSDTLQMRLNSLERQAHLGHSMLNSRVISHGP